MLPLDLAGIAIGAAAFAGAGWMRYAFRRGKFSVYEGLQRWERVRGVLGLKEQRVGGATRFEGRIDGVDVRLSVAADGVAEAAVHGFWPKEIEVSPRSLGQALRSHALECGDPELDSFAALHGPPVETIALLSGRIRRVLARLVRSGGRVENGAVQAILRPKTPGQAMDEVRWLVSIAAMLQHRNGITATARLLEMARSERRSSVRAAAVRAAASVARTPALDAVLRAAIEDRDDDVRRIAAVALGVDAPGQLSIAEGDRRGALSPPAVAVSSSSPSARSGRDPRGR